MTAKELAAKATEQGARLTPETVRKDWSKGAPRGSVDAYLRWREARVRKGASPALKAARLKLIEEQTAFTRARRENEELELAEKRRDLVPMAEVDAKLVATFLPIRQRLMALPAEAAARCNPSDPQLAREALDRWVTDSLPLLRSSTQEAMR